MFYQAANRFLMICCLVVGVPSLSHAVDTPTDSTFETVNINTATEQELTHKLDGIGPAKAKAIVVYRTKYGAFKSFEELCKVDGVSRVTLARLKPYLRLVDEDKPKK
jgi:comEA protein